MVGVVAFAGVAAEEVGEHDGDGEESGEDGGQRGAGHAHLGQPPFAEDERVVEDHVQRLAAHLGRHQAHIVAASAEVAAQGRLDEEHDVPEQQHAQILGLQRLYLRRVTDQPEERRRQEAQQHRQHARQQGQVDALPVHAANLVLLMRTDVVGGDDAGVADDADKQARHHPGHHAAHPRGRYRVRRVLRQKHRVRELHEHQARVRQQQRHRQTRNLHVFSGIQPIVS